MFDSLADRMREDEVRETTMQRLLRYGAIFLVAIVLFGGLYFGVQYLEF